MLRDRAVCGIDNVDVQTRLLKKLDLTFDDAVQTALAMKAAKKGRRTPLAPPPFTVTVDVCGKPLRMEVDTGASVFIMAKSRLLQLLPSVPVQPSQVLLQSYSGELKKVQGKADVSVKLHGREADLPIFLTRNGSPTLLGRNWMRELGISISDLDVNIHALSDIKHLVQDYAEVFEEGLGTFKGAKASLHVRSDAPPRFFKPHPLPYALTDGVTQEIHRLRIDSILVSVKTAKWAALIVPVTKRDRRIRICGDFGDTINSVATVEQYPITRIEDLWTVLEGDEKFTKLNLRDAYQQVVLNEASRKYVTISTHMKLFQYTRLPFGVSSAPVIFQREMENLFKGLAHVPVYFDDILVTGENDAEHLLNLRAVLSKLQESALMLKLEKNATSSCHKLTEQVVQTVKNKFKKSGSGNFQRHISRFLFHYRTTPHEVTGRPPCELLTGRMFKTPLDVLRPSLQASVFLNQLKQKLYADRGSGQAPSLQPGDDVYVRNFRRGTPWVPASVVDGTPSSASARFEDGTLRN
nr:uncharacterized protein K02A2.6-like [Rhipicephalus microplus]